MLSRQLDIVKIQHNLKTHINDHFFRNSGLLMALMYYAGGQPTNTVSQMSILDLI